MSKKYFCLYLIRHGESIRNLQPHLIGQAADEPLSIKGEWQAKYLGEHIRRQAIKFDTICASPYQRAVDTCLIACKEFGGEIDLVNPELREYSAGDMINRHRDEVMTLEVKAKMGLQGMAFKFPGGDSLYDVEARAADWLEERLKEADDKKVVAAFTHGMVIKCLLHHIMQFDQHLTWRMSIDNTSITKLEMRDGAWFIKYINNTEHLLSF